MESPAHPDPPLPGAAAHGSADGAGRPGVAAAPRTPLLAALLSGVTALAAQTVWIRALGRAVGTTTESLAAVAAVFLLGLGLGSAWGGRLSQRTADAGRAAGRCLLTAAVLVLVSPWLFDALPGLHLGILEVLGQEPGPSPWPALLLGLPLLLLPTLLMGASFPLLIAARGPLASHVGRGTGTLYALNTLGAALGTVLTVLALPVLGERLTLSAAAGLEVLAGAALLLSATPSARGQAEPRPPSPGTGAVPLTLCAALALTGLVGLGTEVAAFRLLEPLTGPHLWGLVLLLVPVLLGIALGGWVGGWAADRSAHPQRSLATVLAVTGVLVAASVWVAGQIPWLVMSQGGEDRAARLTTLALGVALALLPPLTALGATYPLAVRAAAAHGASPARASGVLSAWNAAGSVAGSLLVGFVALPAWGAPLTLLALAWSIPAGGALLRLVGGGAVRALPALATALPLVLLGAPPVRDALLASAPSLPEVVALWQQAGMRAGPTLSSRADARLFAEWFGGRAAEWPAGPPGELVPAREGRLGTVALLEEPGGTVRLRVNGLSEARFVADDPDSGSPTERALGLLPSLAHPAPHRALVIGHGAGWTAEAVLATGIEHVDVAELDETVLDVVEEWRRDGRRALAEAPTAAGDGADAWRGYTLAVRSDPHAHLWLTDGRLLLRRAAHAGGAQRYDVIASQPSHPWVPGAGHLFTREAYVLAHDALAQGGVFAQWLNLFEMSPRLLRSAVATFRDVFPSCWLFLFDREAVLLGFEGAPALDPERWSRLLERTPQVQAVADKAGFSKPGDLWGHVLLDAAGLARFAPPADTSLVVDDRPELELGLAWRVLGGADDEDLQPLLRREFPPDLARLLPDAAARNRWTAQAIDRLLDQGHADLALLWDEKVTWGTDPESRLVRAAVARARGELARAETILRGVVEGLSDADRAPHGDWVAGWIVMLSEGARREVTLREPFLASAGPLAAKLPQDGRVRAAMARLRELSGDLAGARAEYLAALKAQSPAAPPGTGAALARLMLTLVHEQGAAPALLPDQITDEHILELLRQDPGSLTDRPTLELMARLESRVGDRERAETAEAALRAMDRKLAQAAFRSAWSLLRRGDGSAWADAERAAELDPRSPRAWELLGLARLQRATRADAPHEGDSLRADAVAALGRAWGCAPDKSSEERRVRTMLGWFGVDARSLVPVEPE